MKPALSGSSLLGQAATLRLLGLIFERPTPQWRAQVEPLAAEIQDAALRKVALDAAASTEGSYLALLGPGGRVSPREVYYRGTEDPGALLADLMAFYRAFAFAPKTEEPADHIAVQVGFLGYLRLKQAYATASGLGAEASTTHDAFESFVASHLRIWVEPLARALGREKAGYLEEAGRLLLDVVGTAPEMAGTPEGEDVEPFSCAGRDCEAGCGIDERSRAAFEI